MKRLTWQNVPENIDDYEGFVYEITNLKNNKKYIGKKLFWSRKRLKPLKGKKRGRIKVVESDWREYWGSSKKLLGDIDSLGERNFSRRIISCYETRWECGYHEARLQFENEVLFRDDYYNDYIGCRLKGRNIDCQNRRDR